MGSVAAGSLHGSTANITEEEEGKSAESLSWSLVDHGASRQYCPRERCFLPLLNETSGRFPFTDSTFIDFKKRIEGGYILRCLASQLVPPRDLDLFSFCYPTLDISWLNTDEDQFGPPPNATRICHITDDCYADHYNRFIVSNVVVGNDAERSVGISYDSHLASFYFSTFYITLSEFAVSGVKPTVRHRLEYFNKTLSEDHFVMMSFLVYNEVDLTPPSNVTILTLCQSKSATFGLLGSVECSSDYTKYI